MKNELKISTLSIVCALCTAVSMPAFGAPAVRSLGGAGTYSSASSAAAAKTGGSVINSVRGGSMRVNSGTTSGVSSTRTGSSSRVATTPRLSIGKYLSKSPSLGTGSVIKPGQSAGGNNGGDNTNWPERIQALEEFMGFGGDKTIPTQFEELELRVDKLAADLGVESVSYADGVLSVKDFGDADAVEYDLSTEFAGKSELEALQSALDVIVAKQYLTSEDLADYAKIADIPLVDDLASKAELSAAVELLEASIAALESTGASSTDLQALKGQVDGLVAQSATTVADVAALKESVDAIQADDMVTKAAVQTLTSSLQGVLDDYLTSEDLENITAALALKANAADVYTKAEVYTKGEVDQAIASAAFDEATLNNYYDKAAADAKFATSGALTELSDTVSQNAQGISGLQSGMALKADAEDVTALSDAVDAMQTSIDTVSQSATDAGLAANAAQQGVGAINETIATYGDIVTHNASEFATAAQGALAESAVQAEDLEEFATLSEVQGELAGKADADTVSGLSDEVSKLSEDLGTVADEVALKANKADVDGKQEKLIAGKFISIGEDGKTITTTYKSSESVQISDDGELSVADDYVTAVDLSDHNMPQGQLAMLVQGDDGEGIWVPINIVSE